MTPTQRRILRAFLAAPGRQLATAEHGIEIEREPYRRGGHVHRLVSDPQVVARALAAASFSAPEPAPADPPVSLPSEHTAGADSGAESPGQPVVRSSSTASGDDAGLGDLGDGARLFDIDELRERPLSPLRDAEAA